MTKTERKQSNRELAAWCRTFGVNPTGQAWPAAQSGERDPIALVALNLADGTPAKRMDDGSQLPYALRAGDYLPAHDATVIGGYVFDAEALLVWVTLSNGQDLSFHPTEPVVYVRKREAPAWVKEVHDEYSAARHNWELAREADTNGWTTEMREFAASNPPPRYADHVKAYWDARKEVA